MGPGEGIQRQKLIDLTPNLEHSKQSGPIYGATYAQHAEMRVMLLNF